MSDALAAGACLLPGGYLDEGGTLHRDVELVPLSGREEELLAGTRSDGAHLVTQVLCHCVVRLGSIRPMTPDVARRLLVGDRQYLLLRLREITFGDRIEGTLSCPWPDCGARVDVDFSISDIPVRHGEERAATYTVDLPAEMRAGEGGESVPVPGTVAFRLPNGEDQEALGPVLAENPARALTGLLERCLLAVDDDRADGAAMVARLSPRARHEIERAMEARAPGVELRMDLACPECGRAFTAPFDLQDFFFGELETSRDLLYRQVHYLAFHYHWSEREILDLPREKRLAYIDILADEIEALNDAV